MYPLLSKSAKSGILTFLALGIIAIWVLVVRSGLNMSVFRVASTASGSIALLVLIIFGSSQYMSPWRWLWRKVPKLNDWLFPDINGVWLGTTKSNWTVVKALREAAESGQPFKLNDLSEIPLLNGRLAMQVEATLFGIRVRSVSGNEGEVRSLAAKAIRDPESKDFSIHYIFLAEMPAPSSTDEGMHTGAATLKFKATNWGKTKGEYWTRRKWREGMNTAGQLFLERTSDINGGHNHDLETQLKAVSERVDEPNFEKLGPPHRQSSEVEKPANMKQSK